MITLSDLISQTWTLYSRNFKTYLKLSFWIFLFTIPGAALGVLLDTLGQTRVINLIISVFLNLLVFILTILVTIVLVRVADRQITEEKPAVSLKKEFGVALAFWFEVLAVAIVVGLIQVAGFLLLIIPGIIFSVWFAFTLYLVILEKAGIKEALLKSKTLVRGRFWGVLVRFFVPTILWSLFGWAISVIFINLVDVAVRFAASSAAFATADQIIKIIGSTYINALLIPLFVISVVILFRNLQKQSNL
jgi:hypothetical protein